MTGGEVETFIESYEAAISSVASSISSDDRESLSSSLEEWRRAFPRVDQPDDEELNRLWTKTYELISKTLIPAVAVSGDPQVVRFCTQLSGKGFQEVKDFINSSELSGPLIAVCELILTFSWAFPCGTGTVPLNMSTAIDDYDDQIARDLFQVLATASQVTTPQDTVNLQSATEVRQTTGTTIQIVGSPGATDVVPLRRGVGPEEAVGAPSDGFVFRERSLEYDAEQEHAPKEEPKVERAPEQQVTVEQKKEAKVVSESLWIPLVILIVSMILVWILKRGKGAAVTPAAVKT
jgi:hypothetical protein